MTTRRRARLAILLPDLRGGGAERVTLALARALSTKGAEIDLVLVQKKGELLRQVPESIRIEDLNVSRLRKILVPFRNYLKERRPDGVIAVMWPLTVLALIASITTRGNFPTIVCDQNTLSKSATLHGRLRWLVLRWTLRFFYPRATAVVAVSRGVADDLAKLSGMRRESIHVIPNAAARGELPEAVSAAELPQWFAPGFRKIVTAGSLKAQKDHATLISAFADARRHVPAKLLILGEGELRLELEHLAERLGIAEDVVMPGFVHDTYPYLLAADLFVLSSRWEGCPLALIEALECGLPVVSTRCPSGPEEILDGGRYGRLTDVADSKQMANQMLAGLAEGRDERKQTMRAREFEVSRAADTYLALFGIPSSQLSAEGEQ